MKFVCASNDTKCNDYNLNFCLRHDGVLFVHCPRVIKLRVLPFLLVTFCLNHNTFHELLSLFFKLKEEHAAEVVDVEGERALVDPYLTFSFGGKEVWEKETMFNLIFLLN